MTVGIGAPFSSSCVAALNDLQNSMMLTPRWPSAGPIGGEGLAMPAGTCSLMYPVIFFAMVSLFCWPAFEKSRQARSSLVVQTAGPKAHLPQAPIAWKAAPLHKSWGKGKGKGKRARGFTRRHEGAKRTSARYAQWLGC